MRFAVIGTDLDWEISETAFMGKTVDDWKEEDVETLKSYNVYLQDDLFFYKLGEFLALDFIEKKLAELNIELTQNRTKA